MGKGMAYGGLPFPDTGCPVPDIYIYCMPDMINVWDTVTSFIHLSWMFPPTYIICWTTDWVIQNGLPLYVIYKLNLG